jgi:translation initiation factor IF-3
MSTSMQPTSSSMATRPRPSPLSLLLLLVNLAPQVGSLTAGAVVQRHQQTAVPALLPSRCRAAEPRMQRGGGPSYSPRPPVKRDSSGSGRGYNAPPPVKDTTPINDKIPHDVMRVLVDVGGGTDELLGVMSKREALAAAAERELDLVLIANKAEPVVCKIVSYDKYRFALEKKKKDQQKAAARGKSELKELKLSYKIGDHDYEVRKKQGIKFLQSGDKVKFSMLFRGREVTHADVGRDIMVRLAEELEEFGVLDATPKVMGTTMIMMISPRPRTVTTKSAPPKPDAPKPDAPKPDASKQ